MERAFAVVAGVVFGALVLFPAVRGTDSYPLSNYPMFSHSIDAVNDVNAVIGREADGTRRRLSPRAVGGADEVMLALQTVNDAIGSGTTAELCAAVADRLAGNEDIATVEVVTERFDTVAWFGGDEEPLSSRVHAGCRVAR
jgi:hypothetical protein